jgi:hypothetical protein
MAYVRYVHHFGTHATLWYTGPTTAVACLAGDLQRHVAVQVVEVAPHGAGWPCGRSFPAAAPSPSISEPAMEISRFVMDLPRVGPDVRGHVTPSEESGCRCFPPATEP